MFWLRNKKIYFLLRTLNLRPATYVAYIVKNMDPDKTAALGTVESQIIVFASMI